MLNMVSRRLDISTITPQKRKCSITTEESGLRPEPRSSTSRGLQGEFGTLPDNALPVEFVTGNLQGFNVCRLNSDRVRRSKGFRDGALDVGFGVSREVILAAIAKGLDRAHQAVITLYDQV